MSTKRLRHSTLLGGSKPGEGYQPLSSEWRQVQENFEDANANFETVDSSLSTLGAALPIGGVIAYPRSASLPIGWLTCDGSSLLRTDYPDLFTAINRSFGTCTITIASPGVVSATAHGMGVGDSLYFTTTGALPTGLAANTLYYVITAGFTANAFQVSATAGGAAINTSGTQSGVHTLVHSPFGFADSTHFNLPDLRGRPIIGLGTHTDVDAITKNDGIAVASRTPKHALTVAELAAHTHSYQRWFLNVSVSSGTGYLATTGAADSAIQTESTGGDTAHHHGYQALNYIIKALESGDGALALLAGSGLGISGSTLSVNVDDSTVEVAADILRVKDAGVTNAKIATGVDVVKLADGTVTNAELQYINTLSSNAQTQIDAKLDDSQIDTDITLAANSDAKIASQKATKAYVDTTQSNLDTHTAETTNVHGIPDTAELPVLASNAVGGFGLETLSMWQRFRLFYNLLTGTTLSGDGSPIAGVAAISALKDFSLPDPATVGAGYIQIIKDVGFEASDYPVTVLPYTTDLIDGGATYTLGRDGTAVAFFTDGTDWFSFAGPNLREALVEKSSSYTILDTIRYIVWTGGTASYPTLLNLPDATGKDGQEHTIKNNGTGACLVESYGVNEIQTVTVVATGGTFTLTYDGQTTSSIAYNAAASTVDTRLEALSNIGAGDVGVTRTGAGTAGNPYIWTVTFTAAMRKTDLNEMTGTSSLTGTGNSLAIATTQTGYHDPYEGGSGLAISVAVGAVLKLVAASGEWLDVT